MRKTINLLFLLTIYSCASADFQNAEKYPDCWHSQRVVMNKCIEMNESGEKVNAVRVEKLMGEGSI